MKNLYKIFIFFMIFQMTAIVVSALDVFPSGTGLFSDLSFEDIEGKSPEEVIGYLIFPEVSGYSILSVILVAIGVGGVAIAFVTKNISIAMVGLTAGIFAPMITQSRSFFNVLFTTWDVGALTYLGLTIGVGLIAILIITLLEIPTHGKSGE